MRATRSRPGFLFVVAAFLLLPPVAVGLRRLKGFGLFLPLAGTDLFLLSPSGGIAFSSLQRSLTAVAPQNTAGVPSRPSACLGHRHLLAVFGRGPARALFSFCSRPSAGVMLALLLLLFSLHPPRTLTHGGGLANPTAVLNRV